MEVGEEMRMRGLLGGKFCVGKFVKCGDGKKILVGMWKVNRGFGLII